MMQEDLKHEADALDGVGNPAREGECGAKGGGPNWLNHFDAMGMLINAFRYNIANAEGCDERFPRSLAKAWPELPRDVRRIIRATLENAFAEIEKTVGAKYGYYSGVSIYLAEWKKVQNAWEKHDVK